jgi:hypothetical protein
MYGLFDASWLCFTGKSIRARLWLPQSVQACSPSYRGLCWAGRCCGICTAVDFWGSVLQQLADAAQGGNKGLHSCGDFIMRSCTPSLLGVCLVGQAVCLGTPTSTL